MKEFLNNFFQSSSERIKNPFIFSFVFSSIFFNWKTILTLLYSTKTIEERIEYVTSCYVDMNNSLYYPLLFSLFYIIALPYLMWLFEKIVEKAKTGRKENLFDEQVLEFKGKKKIAKAEREYEEEKAGNAELSDLNKRIIELQTENEDRKKQVDVLKFDLNELRKEKNKLEQFINLDTNESNEFTENEKIELEVEYKEFIKTESSTYFEKIGTEISQFKSIPKNIDVIIIEKLIYSGIIKRVDDEENNRVYYILTRKGRYFWKKYVLSKNILTKEEVDKRDELPF